uniref:Protein kinase domain-containing protein n=1 Tax=Chromera velia CCMP2878 TaxID=1169474 RepID=A0A0G4I0E9_9ALVE|eukprot:Cvel_9938.t1-p1 / transcript=Cvel_9938.t1 / gene=Cvel_9938 / organism=Chromera_velia_CCMP2878 / gene_product=Probable serine/threonine-protein kinase WNK2, putative / transcript_product=Probable serine/threonine-protein kinase WNK2, putative / location=Cvel_scaffold588:14395-25287(-) / protein_length=2941 / sequence_SO=supercontig / SO=protein_coding / is_pseudo=false
MPKEPENENASQTEADGESAEEIFHPESVGEDEVDEENGVIEKSPKGRFLRFAKKLGAGAYKMVYLGFDTETGREVAWNVISTVHLDGAARKRIGEEINIAKSLSHKRIIKFINAWQNKQTREVVFITERVTGGSLRQYINRLKTPLKVKVVKDWCKQILEGLVHLHSMEPSPIIHRDLKCDNIFINGHVGELLIGDLGLSTYQRSTAASIVGTPEFMAPELYEEKYGTSVDIYAFGMCLLEMVSRKFPYEECATAGQIYRKVMMGEKPAVLFSIKHDDIRQFIELCIDADAKTRPKAEELLKHEFLTTKLNDSRSCDLLDEAEAAEKMAEMKSRGQQRQAIDPANPPPDRVPLALQAAMAGYEASMQPGGMDPAGAFQQQQAGGVGGVGPAGAVPDSGSSNPVSTTTSLDFQKQGGAGGAHHHPAVGDPSGSEFHHGVTAVPLGGPNHQQQHQPGATAILHPLPSPIPSQQQQGLPPGGGIGQPSGIMADGGKGVTQVYISPSSQQGVAPSGVTSDTEGGRPISPDRSSQRQTVVEVRERRGEWERAEGGMGDSNEAMAHAQAQTHQTWSTDAASQNGFSASSSSAASPTVSPSPSAAHPAGPLDPMQGAKGLTPSTALRHLPPHPSHPTTPPGSTSGERKQMPDLMEFGSPLLPVAGQPGADASQTGSFRQQQQQHAGQPDHPNGEMTEPVRRQQHSKTIPASLSFESIPQSVEERQAQQAELQQGGASSVFEYRGAPPPHATEGQHREPATVVFKSTGGVEMPPHLHGGPLPTLETPLPPDIHPAQQQGHRKASVESIQTQLPAEHPQHPPWTTLPPTVGDLPTALSLSPDAHPTAAVVRHPQHVGGKVIAVPPTVQTLAVAVPGAPPAVHDGIGVHPPQGPAQSVDGHLRVPEQGSGLLGMSGASGAASAHSATPTMATNVHGDGTAASVGGSEIGEGGTWRRHERQLSGGKDREEHRGIAASQQQHWEVGSTASVNAEQHDPSMPPHPSQAPNAGWVSRPAAGGLPPAQSDPMLHDRELASMHAGQVELQNSSPFPQSSLFPLPTPSNYPHAQPSSHSPASSSSSAGGGAPQQAMQVAVAVAKAGRHSQVHAQQQPPTAAPGAPIPTPLPQAQTQTQGGASQSAPRQSASGRPPLHPHPQPGGAHHVHQHQQQQQGHSPALQARTPVQGQGVRPHTSPGTEPQQQQQMWQQQQQQPASSVSAAVPGGTQRPVGVAPLPSVPPAAADSTGLPSSSHHSQQVSPRVHGSVSRPPAHHPPHATHHPQQQQHPPQFQQASVPSSAYQQGPYTMQQQQPQGTVSDPALLQHSAPQPQPSPQPQQQIQPPQPKPAPQQQPQTTVDGPVTGMPLVPPPSGATGAQAIVPPPSSAAAASEDTGASEESDDDDDGPNVLRDLAVHFRLSNGKFRRVVFSYNLDRDRPEELAMEMFSSLQQGLPPVLAPEHIVVAISTEVAARLASMGSSLREIQDQMGVPPSQQHAYPQQPQQQPGRVPLPPQQQQQQTATQQQQQQWQWQQQQMHAHMYPQGSAHPPGPSPLPSPPTPQTPLPQAPVGSQQQQQQAPMQWASVQQSSSHNLPLQQQPPHPLHGQMQQQKPPSTSQVSTSPPSEATQAPPLKTLHRSGSSSLLYAQAHAPPQQVAQQQQQQAPGVQVQTHAQWVQQQQQPPPSALHQHPQSQQHPHQQQQQQGGGSRGSSQQYAHLQLYPIPQTAGPQPQSHPSPHQQSPPQLHVVTSQQPAKSPPSSAALPAPVPVVQPQSAPADPLQQQQQQLHSSQASLQQQQQTRRISSPPSPAVQPGAVGVPHRPPLSSQPVPMQQPQPYTAISAGVPAADPQQTKAGGRGGAVIHPTAPGAPAGPVPDQLAPPQQQQQAPPVVRVHTEAGPPGGTASPSPAPLQAVFASRASAQPQQHLQSGMNTAISSMPAATTCMHLSEPMSEPPPPQETLLAVSEAERLLETNSADVPSLQPVQQKQAQPPSASSVLAEPPSPPPPADPSLPAPSSPRAAVVAKDAGERTRPPSHQEGALESGAPGDEGTKKAQQKDEGGEREREKEKEGGSSSPEREGAAQARQAEAPADAVASDGKAQTESRHVAPSVEAMAEIDRRHELPTTQQTLLHGYREDPPHEQPASSTASPQLGGSQIKEKEAKSSGNLTPPRAPSASGAVGGGGAVKPKIPPLSRTSAASGPSASADKAEDKEKGKGPAGSPSHWSPASSGSKDRDRGTTAGGLSSSASSSCVVGGGAAEKEKEKSAAASTAAGRPLPQQPSPTAVQQAAPSSSSSSSSSAQQPQQQGGLSAASFPSLRPSASAGSMALAGGGGNTPGGGAQGVSGPTAVPAFAESLASLSHGHFRAYAKQKVRLALATAAETAGDGGAGKDKDGQKKDEGQREKEKEKDREKEKVHGAEGGASPAVTQAQTTRSSASPPKLNGFLPQSSGASAGSSSSSAAAGGAPGQVGAPCSSSPPPALLQGFSLEGGGGKEREGVGQAIAFPLSVLEKCASLQPVAPFTSSQTPASSPGVGGPSGGSVWGRPSPSGSVDGGVLGASGGNSETGGVANSRSSSLGNSIAPLPGHAAAGTPASGPPSGSAASAPTGTSAVSVSLAATATGGQGQGAPPRREPSRESAGAGGPGTGTPAAVDGGASPVSSAQAAPSFFPPAASVSGALPASRRREADTEELQRCLTYVLPSGCPAVEEMTPGVFDEKTAAAVSSFQASRKLQRDGVVGAKTWAALIESVHTRALKDLSRQRDRQASTERAKQTKEQFRQRQKEQVQAAESKINDTILRSFQLQPGSSSSSTGGAQGGVPGGPSLSSGAPGGAPSPLKGLHGPPSAASAPSTSGRAVSLGNTNASATWYVGAGGGPRRPSDSGIERTGASSAGAAGGAGIGISAAGGLFGQRPGHGAHVIPGGSIGAESGCATELQTAGGNPGAAAGGGEGHLNVQG